MVILDQGRFCITDVNGDVRFCLKPTEKMPAEDVNLFEVSSPFIKKFMYVSLGVLAGLLLIGTLLDTLITRKRSQKPVLGEDKHFTVTLKRRFKSC